MLTHTNVVARAGAAYQASSPISCSANFPTMVFAYSNSFYNNVNWLKAVAVAKPSERAPVSLTVYPFPSHSPIFL